MQEKTKTSQTQDMKSQIIEEAIRLFAVRGFNGTSLQSIADAVGIKKPSLLYHFKSKQVLRIATLDSLLIRWKDIIPQVLLAATSGENRLDRVTDELLSFFQSDPARARFLMREVLDNPEYIREQITEHLLPWFGLATDYIRRGQKEGVVYPNLDPEAWVAELVTLVLGNFAANAVFPSILGSNDKDPGNHRCTQEMIRLLKASIFIPGNEFHSFQNETNTK